MPGLSPDRFPEGLSVSTQTCVVEDCYQEGQHATACKDRDSCSGCVPKLAEAGLLVCRPHHAMGVRALRGLPKVQSDLEPAMGGSHRSPQAPKGEGGRSGETPDVLNQEAFEARQDIHEWLSSLLTFVLIAERLTTPGPGWDVPMMCRLLQTHADALSRRPETAARWAVKVDALYRDGRRIAARSRISGIYLGECPMTVAKDGEQALCGGPIRYQREPGLSPSDRATTIQCPWCKFEETAWWWCQRINPTSRRVLMGNAAQMASLISQKYLMQLAAQGRDINEGTIRSWASADRFKPVAQSIKSRRLLYLLADCEAQAIRAYNLTNPDHHEENAS